MDRQPLIPNESQKKYSTLGNFFHIFIDCTTGIEKALACFGVLFAVAGGLTVPLMSLCFGELTQNLVNITKSLSNHTISPEDLEHDFILFHHGMNIVSFHFFLAGSSYLLFGLMHSTINRYVGEKFTFRMRRKYISKLLRKDACFYDNKSTGELSSILSDNMERVHEGINEKIGMVITSFGEATSGIISAYLLDWKLSSYSIIFALGIAFSGFINSANMMKTTKKQNDHYSNAGSIAFQALGAYKTVISLNGQTHELERYKQELIAGEKYGVIRALFYGLSRGVQYLFVNFLNCVVIYIGTNMIYDQSLDAKTVIQLFNNLLIGGFALSEAFPQISIIASSISSATPIAELLRIDDDEIENKFEDEHVEEEETKNEGKIEFQNVRFSYPTRPDNEVLKNVSFDVRKGECIALVGASGSGKSTIVQLLLHYYNISSGKILIDDQDLSNINLKRLRKMIGVVSQEPILFNATIEENVRFGNPLVSTPEIYAALRKANAYDFVIQFPKGIKTVVGERGAQLSGGQKQRIAIARTLIRNPRILLLDEATSALDNKSESIVQKAFENVSAGRTTIVVAHRLSTIRNADKIIVLQKGEIMDVGNHDSLMEKKGIYWDLVQAQVMDAHDDHQTEGTPILSTQQSHESSPMHHYSYQRSSSNEIAQAPVDDHIERLLDELVEEDAVKSNFIQIFKKCRSDYCIIFFACLTSFIQGFNYPILAQLVANVNEAFAKTGADLLTHGHYWALAFLFLAMGRSITITGQYYLFGKASEKLSTRLRVTSFGHLLSLPCSFYDDPKHSPIRLSTRLNTDASNVKAAVDARFGNVLMTVIAVLLSVSISFWISWEMTLQVLALCPVLYFAEYAYEKATTSYVHENSIAFENFNKSATEALENIKTVRALNMEDKVLEMTMSHLKKIERSCFKISLIQGFAYGLACSSWLFVYAFSLQFGTWLAIRREIWPMDMYRVLMCLTMTSNTAGSAIAYFPDYKKATYAAGLIFKLFTYPATMDVESKDGHKNINDGEISGKDLHFCYDQRKDHVVLNGVNIKVEAGKTIALVGPSGCGKSTIISLLERFYHVTSGEMAIDGDNVEDINLHYLRSRIALVSQEPTLFNCSIKENLIYGLKRQVSQLEIEKALTTANAINFVFAMPQGLDTIVGERGAQLSGGQKQRIAIARAILRNPKILLLDEATSALDTDSEKVVQNALDTASERISTVVVAHRLSTIVNADLIAVLKDGNVVEQGTHEELLKLHAVYWRLIQKQGKKESE